MLDRLTLLFAPSETDGARGIDDIDRSIEQQWDALRDAAGSEAERTEIDAIFGRHAA